MRKFGYSKSRNVISDCNSRVLGSGPWAGESTVRVSSFTAVLYWVSVCMHNTVYDSVPKLTCR